MKAITFDGSNRIYSENKHMNLAIPYQRKDCMALTCYSLTWKERLRVLCGAPIWVKVTNNAMTLQELSLTKPV